MRSANRLGRYRKAEGLRAAATMACAAAVYFVVRELVEGTPSEAARNASRLVSFERTIGFDVEGPIQRFVLDHPLLVDGCNHAYVWLHWPFLIVALVVVFRRDRIAYRRLTGALIASGVVGLVMFATFPTAPPRFASGFVGTVSQAERQHFLPYPGGWANRFASMPSFHAGWTLVAAIALSKTMRTRLAKVLSFAPAPLVAFSVIATGNHFLVDVVAGCAIALGGHLIVGRMPAERGLRPGQHLRPLPMVVRHDVRVRR